MEKLLSKKSRKPNHGVGFFRHTFRIGIKKLRTEILSLPYLINVFLISCSSAELISASVDKNKCKTILGLKLKCKFVAGLSINKSKICKLFLGRVTLLLKKLKIKEFY
jgi:hypothetical protein